MDCRHAALAKMAGVIPPKGKRVWGTVQKPTKGNGGAIMIAAEQAETYGLQNKQLDSDVIMTYGHELANLLDLRMNPNGKNRRKPTRVYGDRTRKMMIPGRQWKIASGANWA
jgi:hypothetical protein